jgi:hypothetical protein
MRNRGASVSAVIAGLDPAIHLLRKNFDAKRMDPRVKPAGDAAGRGKYWINSTGPRISALIQQSRTLADGMNKEE